MNFIQEVYRKIVFSNARKCGQIISIKLIKFCCAMLLTIQ